MAEKDRDEEETKRRAEEDDEDAKSKNDAAEGEDERAEEASEKESAKDDAEDEDHAEEEEEEPKVAKKSAKASSESKSGGKKASPQGARKRRPPPKGGSLGKSLLLFALIIGPLAIAAAYFGREDGQNTNAVAAPKWKVGQTVDVEITVVPSDKVDLACASTEKVADRRCQFDSPGKQAPGTIDDKLMLKPYTTTDRVQFTGAGLWSDPALVPAKLPASRFSVKCKYAVEGKIKPHIRWSGEGPWYPQEREWYAGALSNCNVIPPG